MTELCCPACGSTLRLEVVRMTKPVGAEQLALEQGRPQLVRDTGPARAEAARIAALEAADGRRLARDIVAEVARESGHSVGQIVGRGRSRPLVHARQRAMWEARERGASLHAIAAVLDGRDHTTVLHGCRAHAGRLAA